MEAAVKMAGSLTSGVAGYEAGKYNNAVAKSNAITAERDGVADVGRVRDAARMAMGEQIAAQGSNGFAIGSGSALDALHQSAINAALDELTARRAAAAKARGLRVEGKIAMAQGKNALIQGLVGAGATAAGADWGSSGSAGAGSGGGGYRPGGAS